jgi:signal transduction histidine kinase
MKDLLLFARPPQPRMAAVAPVPILATVITLVRQDPGASGVTIDLDGDSPPIDADAELVKLVLQNLLLNALHAVQGKGVIRVTVRASEAMCTIAVADDGPGIPAAVRDKLFTPFFTTKSRGTGLGLSTAKRFVDAQGGSIAIDCPASGGTVVAVQLHLAASTAS